MMHSDGREGFWWPIGEEFLIAGNKAAYWGTSAIVVRRRVIRTTREHSVTERAGRYRDDPKDSIEA